MEIKRKETMKKKFLLTVSLLMLLWVSNSMMAQQRRPIDSQHPMWFIHVDVWYQADPQKIIDLIPEQIRPCGSGVEQRMAQFLQGKGDRSLSDGCRKDARQGNDRADRACDERDR